MVEEVLVLLVLLVAQVVNLQAVQVRLQVVTLQVLLNLQLLRLVQVVQVVHLQAVQVRLQVATLRVLSKHQLMRLVQVNLQVVLPLMMLINRRVQQHLKHLPTITAPVIHLCFSLLQYTIMILMVLHEQDIKCLR